jgi:superfamily II DNA helicase RecQ
MMFVCYVFVFVFAIGRAGRDGLPSKAVLLYKSDDVNRLRFIMNKDNSNDDARPDFMLSQEDQEVYQHISIEIVSL